METPPRPPHPDAATIVVRSYSQEFPAQLALQALSDARIEATVVTDDCGGLYPQLSNTGFRLMVSAVHREAAEQVLAEVEPIAPARLSDPPDLPPLPATPNRTLLSLPSKAGWLIALSIVGALLLFTFLSRKGEPISGFDTERLKRYRESAERGDPSAQYALAYMYANGRGVRTNAVEAVRWFREAANQDLASAQYALGYIYQAGSGVPKDILEAFKWFHRAAEQGYAPAQYVLGGLYRTGFGVHKDCDQAVRWYRKAASEGSIPAQLSLGLMYDRGEEVSRDATRAVDWYRQAAEQGDVTAQCNLGSLLLTGDGAPKDEMDAYKWFCLAAAQGDLQAQRHLSTLQSRLSPEQLAEGKKRSSTFLPRRREADPLTGWKPH